LTDRESLQRFIGDERAQTGGGRRTADTQIEQETIEVERVVGEQEQTDVALDDRPGVDVDVPDDRVTQDDLLAGRVRGAARRDDDTVDVDDLSPRERAEQRVPDADEFADPDVRQQELEMLTERFRQEQQSRPDTDTGVRQDVEADIGGTDPRGRGGQVAIGRELTAPTDSGRGILAAGAVGGGLGLGARGAVDDAVPDQSVDATAAVEPSIEPVEDVAVDVGQGVEIGPVLGQQTGLGQQPDIEIGATLADETTVSQQLGADQQTATDQDTALTQPTLTQPIRERQRQITTTTPRLRDEPRRPRAGRERGIDIDDDVRDGIDTESFEFGFDPDVGILSGEDI
jgi:hypothetical protein